MPNLRSARSDELFRDLSTQVHLSTIVSEHRGNAWQHKLMEGTLKLVVPVS